MGDELAELELFMEAVLAEPGRYGPVVRELRELFEALEKNRPVKAKRLRAKYRSWAELDRAYVATRVASAADAEARRVVDAVGRVALTVARGALAAAGVRGGGA